jgi:DNA-damage-inducible protein J
MSTKNTTQLQIRIDAKTKKEAKNIFDNIGIDMSSAIKLFLQQTINAKNIPFEMRDENGMTLRNAQTLQEAIIDAENSSKSFNNVDVLIKDILKD